LTRGRGDKTIFIRTTSSIAIYICLYLALLSTSLSLNLCTSYILILHFSQLKLYSVRSHTVLAYLCSGNDDMLMIYIYIYVYRYNNGTIAAVVRCYIIIVIIINIVPVAKFFRCTHPHSRNVHLIRIIIICDCSLPVGCRLSLRCDSLWLPDRNRAASAAVSRKRSLVKPITFLTRESAGTTTAPVAEHFLLGEAQKLFIPTTIAAYKLSFIVVFWRKFGWFSVTIEKRIYSFFNTFIGRIYILCTYMVLVETIVARSNRFRHMHCTNIP